MLVFGPSRTKGIVLLETHDNVLPGKIGTPPYLGRRDRPPFARSAAASDQRIGCLGAPLIGRQHKALALRGLALGAIQPGAGNADLHGAELPTSDRER